jgi:branched-chain amino acid transport system permease protein
MVGGLLSYIGNRVRGDNFMVATLAFQLVPVDVAGNLDVTGGEQGLGGVRPVTLGPFIPGKPAEWVLVVAVFAALVGVIAWLLTRSRRALIWKAVREDESATASLGRGPAWAKVSAFMVSAGGLALAGSLYGSYISYVSPSEFTVSFSVFIISAIIVGGMGNPVGPLVGMVVLTALPEALRFVPGLPLDVKARVLQLLYAAFLLAFLALRPQGLLPEGAFRGRRLRAKLHRARAAQGVPREASS